MRLDPLHRLSRKHDMPRRCDSIAGKLLERRIERTNNQVSSLLLKHRNPVGSVIILKARKSPSPQNALRVSASHYITAPTCQGTNSLSP